MTISVHFTAAYVIFMFPSARLYNLKYSPQQWFLTFFCVVTPLVYNHQTYIKISLEDEQVVVIILLKSHTSNCPYIDLNDHKTQNRLSIKY